MPEKSYQVVAIDYSNRHRMVSFYKSNREKIKVHKSDQCFLLEETNTHQICAAVKFTRLPDQSWLLRNMLVDRNCRQQGLGHQLLIGLTPKMSALAASTEPTTVGLYCFPWTELTDFYCQHGFREVDVDRNLASQETTKPSLNDAVGDCRLFSGASDPVFSHEVTSRFLAYRRRGLDVAFCYWWGS